MITHKYSIKFFIMRFELDHRTGMMRPKKNEEIYFAQSQGGGLIVDDKKNNIKYIIERDGRITKLFGNFDKDNLNLYDMRDARIIADRVSRLLGRDHKYTDFHYFLRGYRMSEGVIKTCSDFLEESIWSDIQDRSMGKTRRKEDGVKVHTCIDVDIYLKSTSDFHYDELIKEILSYNDSYVDYRVGILSVRDKAYSPEEMKNMRAFEAPYSYLIFDGRYGTSLVAEFWTYDEMKDFDLDDFEDRICEEDYISICKGIATKLKEIGGSIEYLPRNNTSYIGNKKNNMNYEGDYVLQLIDESDVNNWEIEYVDKYGEGSTSTSLEDFKENMIYDFPELDDVEFITWSYNNYACSIGIPITATTVKNFKKYKEYTKNWFTIDEEAE